MRCSVYFHSLFPGPITAQLTNHNTDIDISEIYYLKITYHPLLCLTAKTPNNLRDFLWEARPESHHLPSSLALYIPISYFTGSIWMKTISLTRLSLKEDNIGDRTDLYTLLTDNTVKKSHLLTLMTVIITYLCHATALDWECKEKITTTNTK